MPITPMTRQLNRLGGRRTVTPKEQVAVPQSFVAVHVTSVDRFAGKKLPEGGEQITGPMLPEAVGVK